MSGATWLRVFSMLTTGTVGFDPLSFGLDFDTKIMPFYHQQTMNEAVQQQCLTCECDGSQHLAKSYLSKKI